MDSQERQVIALDLTLRELNHNHKYRMARMILPPPFYRLADLGIVKQDESLYLMPLIECEYTLTMSNSAGHRSEHPVLPNSGLHIYLHDSGVVNVCFGTERIRLRDATGSPAALGPVFGIVVTSTAGLREATTDEINSSPAKKRVLPLVGAWRLGSVGMTLYRSAAESTWTAPTLGDAVQVNLHMPMQGKTVDYHLVVWQHQQLKPAGGELEIYLPAA